jgi:hypothetical protein
MGAVGTSSGWWVVVALLALSATSVPAEDDAGTLANCPRRAVAHRRLKCPDGLSACDLDDQCDSTCVLAWCVDFIAACRPARVRLCRIGEPPAGTALVRAGRKARLVEQVAGNVFTKYSAKCQPARGCRPDPTICEVTFAGAKTDTSPCRVGLLHETGTDRADLVLTTPTGEALMVHLAEAPDVGTFTSDVAPFASMESGTVSVGLSTAYVVDPIVGGSLTLKITAMPPSASIFHAVHGELDATLVPSPATGGAELQVHAEF